MQTKFKKMTKLFKLFFFSLFGLSLTSVKAQNAYVLGIDKTQESISLNDIKKMTFSSGNLILNKNTGVDENYVLDKIRYLNFTDFTLGGMPANQLVQQIIVYPNPAKNVLNISISDQSQLFSDVEIISSDGRVVQQHKVNPDNHFHQISISALPPAVYFCKLSNNLNTEIIKFIKQ